MLPALAILAVGARRAAPLNRAQNQPRAHSQPPQRRTRLRPIPAAPAPIPASIALPKKKEQPDDTPRRPRSRPRSRIPKGCANYSLRIDVPEVTVDVGVLLEKTHQFVPNLKPANFRVYEDGVEQKIVGFKRVEAPITALLLCEFASTNYSFIYDMRNAAWAFAQQLRPQDYVAMMTFDMRTQIVTDFTQDKRQFYEAINH